MVTLDAGHWSTLAPVDIVVACWQENLTAVCRIRQVRVLDAASRCHQRKSLRSCAARDGELVTGVAWRSSESHVHFALTVLRCNRRGLWHSVASSDSQRQTTMTRSRSGVARQPDTAVTRRIYSKTSWSGCRSRSPTAGTPRRLTTSGLAMRASNPKSPAKGSANITGFLRDSPSLSVSPVLDDRNGVQPTV